MHEIKKYDYTPERLSDIKAYRFGVNWPVVYILEDGKEAYIGETVSAFRRARNHIEKPEREKLDNMYVIADEEYNKSAILDIESSLIKYVAGDGRYLLQNGNKGISDHNYYDRPRYQAKFRRLWKDLQKLGLVNQNLLEIENKDLFKFSPYKTLSKDQLEVVEELLRCMAEKQSSSHLITGDPGTGKTVLAVYLIKRLLGQEDSKNLEVALVVPMTSLRKTLRGVFKKIKGLKANMVIGPNEVVNKEYDILIVDEAHRLKRRKSIMGMAAFDRVNERLGLDKYEGNQLDWVMQSAKHKVFFYDPKQSIKPADVRAEDFDKYDYVRHTLSSQLRVEGGEDYLNYIKNIFNNTQEGNIRFYNYDFKLFDNIHAMIGAIKEKNREYGLCRVVAGYAWEWKTKSDDSIDYDIEIDGLKLKWNSKTQDWVNSEDSINEVGCIHTVQGYDLNYTGVIIGPEFGYNPEEKQFFVNKDKYKDTSGSRGIEDEEELFEYIKNIYTTLLTRGIKGTYVYASDEGLRNYLHNYIRSADEHKHCDWMSNQDHSIY